MDKLTSVEQKKISLEILNCIDKLCREHGFHYYIAYGTLIGAVRHRGFIPWDDDIDIWVPLSELELFLETVERETEYAVVNHLRDTKWHKCFSKISDTKTRMLDHDGNEMAMIPYGVSVDVFPLFCAKKDDEWCGRIKRYKRKQAMLLKYRLGKYRGLRFAVQNMTVKMMLAAGHDETYWKRKFYEAETETESSDHIGCVISPYLGRDIHDRSDFEKTCELEFEGADFTAPAGWDAVLRNIYGDYMKLPPEEKRVSHHEEVAYRL